jgi:hypothetical protein
MIYFAIQLASQTKDYVPADIYNASVNTLKTWFNSDDPAKWSFNDFLN